MSNVTGREWERNGIDKLHEVCIEVMAERDRLRERQASS